MKKSRHETHFLSKNCNFSQVQRALWSEKNPENNDIYHSIRISRAIVPSVVLKDPSNMTFRIKYIRVCYSIIVLRGFSILFYAGFEKSIDLNCR